MPHLGCTVLGGRAMVDERGPGTEMGDQGMEGSPSPASPSHHFSSFPTPFHRENQAPHNN